MTKKLTEQQIIESWNKNVQAWTHAVREGEIESRALVTDKAIVDAVMQRQPRTVLDIGCGEGWLARELTTQGIDALGIDIVAEFIESAKQQNIGRFQTLAYADITVDVLKERFDVLVCNFSLLGKQSVEQVFSQVPLLLHQSGAIIVQTLHPVVACGEQPYQDGWRQGSWAGFSEAFTDPAPWYFRTRESWESLFVDNGLCLIDIVEPLHPKTKMPASIIFVGEHAGN